MALAHCILGKFLGVGCYCFSPPLDVPTFSVRCLHVQRRERSLAAEGGTLRGREMFRQISSRIRLPRNSRELLHAANLRHGTDGFTSPPKEGVLRIFSTASYMPWLMKKVTEHKMWVLIFSKTFVPNISHSGKNWVTYNRKCTLTFISSTHSCQILIKTWIFSTDFLHILIYQISQKSVRWKPSCSMWMDGRMDRHNKANLHFLQY